MRIASLLPVVARVLLGALFVVSGANKLVPFMPAPADLPPGAASFLGALIATGYMLPLIGAIEVLFGALLVAGRFVPLALTVLAPLVVNIVLFHVVLFPVELGMIAFVLVAELYLAWVYRAAFRGVLQATAAPHAAADDRSLLEGRTSLAS